MSNKVEKKLRKQLRSAANSTYGREARIQYNKKKWVMRLLVAMIGFNVLLIATNATIIGILLLK